MFYVNDTDVIHFIVVLHILTKLFKRHCPLESVSLETNIADFFYYVHTLYFRSLHLIEYNNVFVSIKFLRWCA